MRDPAASAHANHPQSRLEDRLYIYQPTAIARLPVPSDTNIIFFTDASITQQRTSTVGGASVRVTRRADGLQVEHQTSATIV